MAFNTRHSLLSALVAPTLAAFGPAFSTGPVSEGVYIKSATATLILPMGNLPMKGDFSLWCGMGTSKGDLIQSIVERTPRNSHVNTPCEHVHGPTEWCGYSYTLFHSGYQNIGHQTKATTGDEMTFDYKYHKKNGNYTQDFQKNGKIISRMGTSDGYALGWGTATECAANDCGSVPSHTWVDTVITLSAADPAFGKTQGQSAGVISTGFSSADGGVTWKVANITIPAFSY